MKSKIMKLVTVMLLLITLTMINFVYVGVGFISLAAEDVSTNHRNIEYTAVLKTENLLTLSVTVKNEGYFNGEITLENSNFTLKNSSSEYVNKIEGNKITLNQINAGSTASFDVEIEPVKDDSLDAGLLSAVSELTLTGVYKDSTERDININATRAVKLEYLENNSEDNVENTMELITNKIVKVNGEDATSSGNGSYTYSVKVGVNNIVATYENQAATIKAYYFGIPETNVSITPASGLKAGGKITVTTTGTLPNGVVGIEKVVINGTEDASSPFEGTAVAGENTVIVYGKTTPTLTISGNGNLDKYVSVKDAEGKSLKNGDAVTEGSELTITIQEVDGYTVEAYFNSKKLAIGTENKVTAEAHY